MKYRCPACHKDLGYATHCNLCKVDAYPVADFSTGKKDRLAQRWCTEGSGPWGENAVRELEERRG